ncbi:MAG: 2,4-dihydroxyhept-2-ene-1,7-dioic acid aldolase [Planctomycetes bacterium]|nr:2,4-dihydroxyhept-2-ene-1,7-dioic acid aldolase [Planctomycetota bacterium]
MEEGRFRKALLRGETTFGTWVQIGDGTVGEILAEVGYDWIAVDCEHTEIHVEGFTRVARSVFRRGATVLARVRENDTLAIRQVLDAGAEGVIVPLVNTADEAARAVAAAKYPPDGVRGFSFSRMNNWGQDFDQYAETANENTAVIVMIESQQAVENIEDILVVEGVDGVFIGPYDMSGSYGIPGQTDHPAVREGCRKVVTACQNAGKAAGLHVVRPEAERIERAIEDGYTLIALGVDTVFLAREAQKALKIARDR